MSVSSGFVGMAGLVVCVGILILLAGIFVVVRNKRNKDSLSPEMRRVVQAAQPAAVKPAAPAARQRMPEDGYDFEVPDTRGPQATLGQPVNPQRRPEEGYDFAVPDTTGPQKHPPAGMKRCPSCGQMVDSDVDVCPYCGSAV